MENNRERKITIRLTHREYDVLSLKCAKSTCKKLSMFIRLALFKKPITILERNHSLDEMIVELSALRTELNRIGNNLNQATKRLHTLSEINEFKGWLEARKQENETLFHSMDQLKSSMDKLADRWLQ